MYTIERAAQPPELAGGWDHPSWRGANVLRIEAFHPQSSDHRPEVRAKLLHDGNHLYLIFHVHDRYVRALCTQYQSQVCRDSCVEFFVQPRPELGYFNFEMNCGGTLLVYYVQDPARVDGGLRQRIVLPEDFGSSIRIHSSLQAPVEPEITEPVDWWLACAIPLAALERYVGPLGEVAGQQWRANFYKCGDDTSHPHWGSWSPIGEELNFHQPRFFGSIRFA